MTLACAGRRVAIRAVALLLLWGCAGVKVVPVHPKDYLAEQRGDILSAGRLSASTTEALRMLGIDATACPSPEARCREALAVAALLGDDRRLSALAELWLQQALGRAAPGWSPVDPDAIRDAYLEAARYAYAYLFFTARRPSERVFEDRQTQVRDYYNFAEKEAITLIFPRYRGAPRTSPMTLREGVWNLHVRLETGRDGEQRLPQELIQASALGTEGAGLTAVRVSNSIENLSEKALFLRLADTMPIAPAVEYHSIIGNNTPGRPLQDSDDGVVPYRSAHLDGAASEKVIASWHDVQETPEAILELRRILRSP